MRPSDFIMNSDYLSIAQTSSNTYDLTIGGGSLVLNGYSRQVVEFAIKATKGAIDRIMISKDGGSYRLGSYMSFSAVWTDTDRVSGSITVHRVSSSTIRATVALQNYASGTSNYPSMSFRIKVASFKPPNIV